VDARVTRLTGDAENSPIVFSKTGATVITAIKISFLEPVGLLAGTAPRRGC